EQKKKRLNEATKNKKYKLINKFIGGDNSTRLQALQQSTAGNMMQKRLAQALALIRRKCRGGANAASGSGLHLPIDVQNMAGELFKIISELKEFKGKQFTPKVACCVYIAAKQCRCDRPLKELCQEFQTTTADVKKVHTEIKKQQAAGRIVMPKASRTFNRESTAEIYALRYCNELKLPFHTVGRNIQEIVKNIEKFGLLSGKQPTTIAAVAVYLGSAVLDEEKLNKSFKDISSVSSVTETTIQNALRPLHAIRDKLLPPGYGDMLKIEHLPLK
ncbi:general transcription factor IIB-like protein, partial [Reticulomyxa filosa]